MNCLYCNYRVNRDFNIVKGLKKFKVKDPIKHIFHFLNKGTRYWSCGFDYIEHTSSNPVGKPHLGNIINAIKGNFLSLMNNLRPSFYVNDIGSNYSKFLLNYENNLNFPLDELYTREIEKFEVNKKRSEITMKKNFITPLMLDYICQTLKEWNLNVNYDYFYESSMIPRIKKLEEYLKHKGSPFYKNLRMFTDDWLPLYSAGDFIYRGLICKKFENPLIITGPDHSTHEANLKKIYPKIQTLTYPVMRINSEKASKRNKNVVDLEQLSKDLDLCTNKTITYFKLYLLKYDQSPFINYEDLIKKQGELEKLNNWIWDLKNKCTISLDFSQPQSIQSINLWGPITYILHDLNRSKKLNRIYHFLIACMKIKEGLNYYCSYKFCKSLGFYD